MDYVQQEVNGKVAGSSLGQGSKIGKRKKRVRIRLKGQGLGTGRVVGGGRGGR